MSPDRPEIEFEVVEEGGPEAQRPGPVSQYEPVVRAVIVSRPGTWVKVQTPANMQPQTLRTTISGLLRRRGIMHRTAVRPEEGGKSVVWVTRTKSRK
jgi:hypothetical protein